MFLPLKDENPTVRTPWVTGTLILVNGFAFGYQVFGGAPGDRLVSEFGLVPARLLGRTPDLADPFTLLTSMFLHGSIIHLFGNLLYLWIFGNNVEDVLGHARFGLFYLLAGLGGHAAHVATNAASPVPTIGASGAIAGVLAAYLLRFPRARVLSAVFLVFFVRLIRVPASLVIGFWLIVQVLGGVGQLGTVATGGIAWFEHLGGFVTGLAMFRVLEPRPARRIR